MFEKKIYTRYDKKINSYQIKQFKYVLKKFYYAC